MRTILFFALTCFASTLTLMGNPGQPLFLLIAIAAWVPYILHIRRRRQWAETRRRRAYLQERCNRAYLRRHSY